MINVFACAASSLLHSWFSHGVIMSVWVGANALFLSSFVSVVVLPRPHRFRPFARAALAAACVVLVVGVGLSVIDVRDGFTG